MSRARSVPAFIVENSAPWMKGTAIAKARNELGREAVQHRRGPQAGGVHGHEQRREDERRDDVRRLAQGARRRSAGRDCRSASGSALTGRARLCLLLLRRPRASARSSRGTRRRGSARAAAAARRGGPRRRARARPRRARSRRLPERTATPCGEAWVSSPNCASTSATRSRCSWSSGHDVHRRPADRRLQLGRRALGDDLAVVDDPDPVAEDVGLLEVLRRQEDGDAVLLGEPRDLLPERGPRLRVEAGRRLVEEEDARAVDEREREVEPALHPAGVRPHLAVGGVGQADALEQLVAARLAAPRAARRGAPSAGACARGRSAAGRAPPPGARRRSPSAPSGPRWTMSKPGHRRRARARRQERRQHVDGGRLARRRSGRGSRRSRPRRRGGRCPSTASTPPLNSRTSTAASMPFDAIVRAYRLG